MMNNNIEARIEELENNGMVIVNLVLADGNKMDMEMFDGSEDVVALEVVTVEQYEENGYEVEGLEVQAIEV